ncbi:MULTISPECIES: hypothetical protein [unclassified Streptomyces]|uniref:hypothetical protein n=1 Tax=unclassified Streptomyces TaxID=2593676 RepID=UPI002DDBB659|nr:hypothetical protein [Streptomyces sp. NBC_01445]WSE11329.1 hypothetical protein OG574_49730 [Streptomyces sp. NBC_01445]
MATARIIVHPPLDTGRRRATARGQTLGLAYSDANTEAAPAHQPDTAAADVLVPLCEQISETLDNGLAAHRYAISDDRRALHGTVR